MRHAEIRNLIETASTTVFPTLVASPQTPDRTEEIIAVATLWTRQRGEKLR